MLVLLVLQLPAQGLETRVSRDEWEEINFEFNSSVLVDGFPSLLRLAELLQANPNYKVKLEGHTDVIGNKNYNEKLGMARSTTVRDFLTKYGARPGQIEIISRGFDAPRGGVKGGEQFRKTDEPRWMNRRVAVLVTDAQGRTIGSTSGGAGDAIRAMQPAQQAADCCNEVLKKLDKLDTLERMLKDLADQNKGLQNELAGLKQNQDALKQAQDAMKSSLDASRPGQQALAQGGAGQAGAMGAAGQPGGAGAGGACCTGMLGGAGGGAADAASSKATGKSGTAGDTLAGQAGGSNRHFQLLGLNVGPTNGGEISFTGKGRYFLPFGGRYGFQSEAEYFYFKGRKEGQFDFGLVDRLGKRVQAGMFASMKHVSLAGDQTGGTIGQAALSIDYLFSRGKVGAFGTKAFLDNALINRTNLVATGGVVMPNLFVERYLRVVDQVGISSTIGLYRNHYLEGNFGYLKSVTSGDRFGGTLRFVFPLNDKIAFTVEGGVNETLLAATNNGRAVVGVQFGNFIRPKEYLNTTEAVPAQIPRVRYEVLSRVVRTGNGAPIADAGPNQTLATAQTVTLNGAGSYDPDGDALTYQWAQESGPAVTITNPTGATASFAAAAGQAYAFRLTVRDSSGAQGVARTTVTVTGASVTTTPVISSFTADRLSITEGESALLTWTVTGAEKVVVTDLGNVPFSGFFRVAPPVTTTYQLTATAGSQVVSKSVTVTVVPRPRITNLVSQPNFPGPNASTTITCSAVNATTVQLGSVTSTSGTASIVVNPSATSTYTCTATGASGAIDQRFVTVLVNGV